MYLNKLRLQQFRNHINSSFDFCKGPNVLLGDNGQGKTNVIEAISYLCLTKSFYASSDRVVLNFNSTRFEIEGSAISDHGQNYNLRVAYSEPQKEKVFTINKHHVEPFSEVIGKFPVVICSPEHAPITTEGPTERRKFIDFVISQSNDIYFQNLLEYRHILRQRNKILFDGKTTRQNVSTLLEPWNEQLIKRGSYLMSKRKIFVDEFQEFIKNAYYKVANESEEPSIEYTPAEGFDRAKSENDIQDILRSTLAEKAIDEMRMGSTLAGPHRDEFLLRINGLDLRRYASQGQHKTFLIALKIGEFYYLNERCNETPILLLDDVFSELDEHRSSRLLNFVNGLSQTFITSTNPHLFDNNIRSTESTKTFYIQSGSVVEHTNCAA